MTASGRAADRLAVAAPGDVVRLPQANDFDRGRSLGEGGMGIVFEARQRLLGRSVALKTLHPHLREGRSAARFADEARIMGALEHPGIVPVHAFGPDERGRTFLAMKQVRGVAWNHILHPETPEEMTRAQATSLRDHLKILLRVCEAVSFAHSRGIVHRDLKPDNVMIGAFGEVQVTDWGLALELAKRAGPGAEKRLSGTPGYASPEVALGDESRVGPRSDVYLLGGILYEILTGTRPHLGETMRELLEAAASGTIERPEERAPGREIPSGLSEIALCALQGLPEKRYASAAAFARAIEGWIEHEASETLALHALRRLGQLKAAERGPAWNATATLADYGEASSELERALLLWPENRSAKDGLVEARLTAAELALDEGDPALAATHLDKLPRWHERADALRRRADEIRRARRWERSRRWLLRGLVAAALAGVAVALPLAFKAERRADRAEEADERRRRALEAARGAGFMTEEDKIRSYTAALEIDPTWREAHLELAGALQDRAYACRMTDPAAGARELEASRAVLERLIAQAPGDTDAVYYRGYAYQMLGDEERALADFRRVAAGGGESGATGIAAATMIAFAERRFADAERLATALVDRNGGDEDDVWRRGLARFVRGDMIGGLADMERLRRKDPASAEYDSASATFLLALGRRHEAEERLVLAVTKHPRAPHAFPLLALLAARRGDRAEAEALAARALAERKAFARCYLDFHPLVRSLAFAPPPYDRIGRASTLALDLAPEVPEGPAPGTALRDEGFAALARGDAQAALLLARRALADSPADGLARLLRGRALASLGLKDAARADLRLVPALAPSRAGEAAEAMKTIGE